MNKTDKITLLDSLVHDTNFFIQTFKHFNLVFDDSFFDYELLKAAVIKGRVETANFLLSVGCRVRNPNKTEYEETPLHIAMIKRKSNLVSKLLFNGASIYDKNREGETPLYAAFKKENYRIVDFVLDHLTNNSIAIVDKENEDDILHFHIACIRNHLNSVKFYLSYGFDVNAYMTSVKPTKFKGLNPLHYAASKGYSELFKVLSNHDGNLSIPNKDGFTPLHIIYYKHFGENHDGRPPGHLIIIQAAALRYPGDITEFTDESIDNDYSEATFSNFKKEFTEAFTNGNETKYVDTVDKNGLSHYHLTCSINQPHFVEAFIKRFTDLNTTTSINSPVNPGFSPLHFAIWHDCPEVVELLLKHGADINATDKFGLTPLHLACKNSRTGEKIKIIKLLLNYNACLTATDKKENTPVHTAFYNLFYCLNSEEDVFDILLSKMPMEKNVINKDKLSLFHIACTKNNTNLVEKCLNSGVAIDSCVESGKYSGYTALHFAVLFNQKDVVELLLKRKAQVDIETKYLKQTPLHLACKYEWIKYCKLAKSTSEPTLNCISKFTDQLEIIKLLLGYGAIVNATDSSSLTPLSQACIINKKECIKSDWQESFKDRVMNEIHNKALEIIKLLLSNKANMKAYTNKKSSFWYVLGKSSLLKNAESVMECLVNAGADINAVDNNGLTALHYAVRTQNKEFVEILLKRKANVYAKSRCLRTPLYTAIEINNNFETKYNSHYYYANPYQLWENNDKGKNISREVCDLLFKYCDVNKNNQYYLLFHNAIQHCNFFLVEKFLQHGIDINFDEYSLNSAIDCLQAITLEDYILEYDSERNRRVGIIKCIHNHIQMLLALGLYVSKNIQTNQTIPTYDVDLEAFKKCKRELKRLKLKKIDNCNSLYHILVKNSHEVSKHVKNRDLIKILEDPDTEKDFPFYINLLKLQFKKGSIRRKILETAETLLIHHNDLYLPYTCCDIVFKYLTNKDICNLIAAANRKSIKRKLPLAEVSVGQIKKS